MKPKKCPFCGGKPKVFTHIPSQTVVARSHTSNLPAQYNVQCDNFDCGTLVPWKSTMERAVMLWNRRAKG